MKTIICKHCNKKKTTTAHNTKFCSDSCKTMDFRKRNPESAKKWSNTKGGKEYYRNFHYLRKYKIDINEYNLMFKKQKGCCVGCNMHQKNIKIRLCIDHCHTTGKIRKLLCYKCNAVLGLVDDNINTLKRLSKYLTEHNTQ